MTRLIALNPKTATGKAKELFIEIETKLGMVPNMMKIMGHSPALLQSYFDMSILLGGGLLGGKMGELITLAISESNACDYCLSAHTYIGANKFKIDAETSEAARRGESSDRKTDAALKFAKKLVSKRGLVNEADVNAVKNAGLSEGEIGEIVGLVAMNTMSNYFNNMAKTEIDFPLVKAFSMATV